MAFLVAYSFEKSLNPENKRAKKDDTKIVSLSNVIVDKQYNDLGFLVNDKLIVMVEAQSTRSENIVIRILMYLSETYSNYFNERDVYFPKEDVNLDLKVRVMHDGKKDDILNQYVTFSKLTVDYAEKFKGEPSAFVINEVIDFCLSKNVLPESNRKSKSEGIKK